MKAPVLGLLPDEILQEDNAGTSGVGVFLMKVKRRNAFLRCLTIIHFVKLSIWTYYST